MSCHGMHPANPEYSSLNLAAAVQILAMNIEWHGLPSAGIRNAGYLLRYYSVGSGRLPATHDDMERFFGHLSELMEQVDFHKGRAPEMVTARLRRLYLRANMDVREIKILRGLFPIPSEC